MTHSLKSLTAFAAIGFALGATTTAGAAGITYNQPVTYTAPVVYTASVVYSAGVTYAAGLSQTAAAQPVLLERVVVTPKGRYTAAEWQSRQARRQQLVAEAAPVLLDKVIVTPARNYSVAEWRAQQSERQFAALQQRPAKSRNWLHAVWRSLGFKRQPLEVQG